MKGGNNCLHILFNNSLPLEPYVDLIRRLVKPIGRLDINAINKEGYTVVHYLLKNNYNHFCEILQDLMSLGADPIIYNNKVGQYIVYRL